MSFENSASSAAESAIIQLTVVLPDLAFLCRKKQLRRSPHRRMSRWLLRQPLPSPMMTNCRPRHGSMSDGNDDNLGSRPRRRSMHYRLDPLLLPWQDM